MKKAMIRTYGSRSSVQNIARHQAGPLDGPCADAYVDLLLDAIRAGYGSEYHKQMRTLHRLSSSGACKLRLFLASAGTHRSLDSRHLTYLCDNHLHGDIATERLGEINTRSIWLRTLHYVISKLLSMALSK